jgi:hypothetical protein
MLASTQFRIARGKDDDWFDAILNADTRLFVDPFLVFKEPADSPWSDAHSLLIQHFDHAFTLIAEGNLKQHTIPYQKALALLLFREPREFCLGYTARGTSGSGSAEGYAELIAEAISEAIKRGLKHPRHFEELGILNQGIGSDRISDITCTILKERLVGYTQGIARRHNIPMELRPIYGARFDHRRMRWETPVVDVPVNPFNGGPLLLVPQRFLRDLPCLNAYDWWNNYENERLRQDVNYEIMGHVDKARIVAAARGDPAAVRRWTLKREKEAASSYDFTADPNGVWKWDSATAIFAAAHPLALVAASSRTQFAKIIQLIVEQFKLFIEEQGGWDLLWNTDGTEKPEHAAQLVFRGIASHIAGQTTSLSTLKSTSVGARSISNSPMAIRNGPTWKSKSFIMENSGTALNNNFPHT